MNKQMMMFMLSGKVKKTPEQLAVMALDLEAYGMRSQANMIRKIAIFKRMQAGKMNMPLMGSDDLNQVSKPSYNIGGFGLDGLGGSSINFGDDIQGLGELASLAESNNVAGESYNFGGDDVEGFESGFDGWGD